MTKATFIRHTLRRNGLQHLTTTERFEGKRTRGRQREKIMDSVTIWLGKKDPNEIFDWTWGRDYWRVTIVQPDRHGTIWWWTVKTTVECRLTLQYLLGSQTGQSGLVPRSSSWWGSAFPWGRHAPSRNSRHCRWVGLGRHRTANRHTHTSTQQSIDTHERLPPNIDLT